MKDSFFPDVDTLVEYLYSIKPDITPLRLQKSLYFLYAYYGAFYGKMGQDDEKNEVSESYPKHLFPAKFEAWKYGPVIFDVYQKNKANAYALLEHDFSKYATDVLEFLNELIEQLNSVSDFSLVERSHIDESWKTAYQSSMGYDHTEMDNDSIVAEYAEKYIS